MRLNPSIVALAGGLLAIVLQGPPAIAAMPAGFTGHAESSVPGCPYLAWRLVRANNGNVTGIAYYSDLSGVSMVKGTMSDAGQFHLVLTPSMGNGPSGTIEGTRKSNGAVEANLSGQGCANMHLVMQPLTDVNHWTNYGGQ